MPESELNKAIDDYFNSCEWNQLISKWKSMALDKYRK